MSTQKTIGKFTYDQVIPIDGVSGIAYSSSNPMPVSASVTPAVDYTASGNITAQNANLSSGTATANSTVATSTMSGASTADILVTGTFTETLVAQVSVDGSNWASLASITNLATGATSSSITAAGTYQVAIPAASQFRVTASAYTSGTAAVSIRASTGVSASSGGGSGGNVNINQIGGSSYTQGQKTSSASAPVVIASDQSNVPISTRGTSVILNPAVTAAAYTTGNVVGGLLSFTNATGALGSGVLQAVMASLKISTTVTFKLYLFNSNPSASTFTDKTAPAIAAADVGKLIGVYSLINPDNGLGTNTIYSYDGIGKQFSLASGTTLYGVLVVVGAPTFASTSDVFVGVGILQD